MWIGISWVEFLSVRQTKFRPSADRRREQGVVVDILGSVSVELVLRYLWVVIIVFVIALWLLVSLLISVMGGWRMLSAKEYEWSC